MKEDYQPESVDISEEEVEEFPEIHGDLDDLVGVPPGVALELPVEEEDLEITDEDIEDAFTNIVRDELKSELIALEDEILAEKDLATFKEEEPVLEIIQREHQLNNFKVTLSASVAHFESPSSNKSLGNISLTKSTHISSLF